MVPKSAEEAARLRKILSRNYLFSELATGKSEGPWYVFLTAHKVMPLGAYRQTLDGHQQQWISDLIDEN